MGRSRYMYKATRMCSRSMDICVYAVWMYVFMRYGWLGCTIFLQVEVESQRLAFRSDCSPHADIGVKQNLLHMLVLSYNPAWLKLGLEVRKPHCIIKWSVLTLQQFLISHSACVNQTVFGELVPIPAHSDSGAIRVALGTFILAHLLSNSQLEETYGYPAGIGGFRHGQSEIIFQLTRETVQHVYTQQ